MRSFPRGTVTFLFTDVEGSTRLLHELGDGYAAVLVEHRRVLREAFARHGGVEVDTQGDAFFVAFSRASDALRARAHVALPWPKAGRAPSPRPHAEEVDRNRRIAKCAPARGWCDPVGSPSTPSAARAIMVGTGAV